MAVGMRIRNNGNILQIDGTYQNLELLASGTVQLTGNDNNQGVFADVGIPGNTAYAVMAVRSANEGVFVVRQTDSVFRIYLGGRDTNRYVTYYIFSQPNQNSPGGVGLVIRDENTGRMVFNSNKKYLRVLQAITGTIGVGGSIPVSFPGKTVALIQNTRPWQKKVESGGTAQQPIFVVQFYSGTMRTPDASTAVVDFRQYMALTGFGGQPVSLYGSNWCDWTVIDVTGY